MYRPKFFAENRVDVLHEFIRNYPLATLITSGHKGIMANLVPMSLHLIGEMGTLRCHLSRANTQIESLSVGDEILIIFNGPQSYVSPEFYETKKSNEKVVPTWNYSMVQVRGQSKVIDDPQWILQQINDLTDTMETKNETNWKVSDAPKAYITGQLNAIVGVEILIEKVEGKFKVSQNQPEVNRNSVYESFLNSGNKEMASLVKNGGYKK